MDIHLQSASYNMMARTISSPPPPSFDGQQQRRTQKPLPQIPTNIGATNVAETGTQHCQWGYSAPFPMQQVPSIQQPQYPSYVQVVYHPTQQHQQQQQPSRHASALTAPRHNSSSPRRHSFSEAVPVEYATAVHMPHDMIDRNASLTNLTAHPALQQPPPPYKESLKIETSSLHDQVTFQKPFEPASSSSTAAAPAAATAATTRELHSPNTPEGPDQLIVSTSNISNSTTTLLSPTTPSNTSTPKDLVPPVSLHSPATTKIPSPWGSATSFLEPIKPAESAAIDTCKKDISNYNSNAVNKVNVNSAALATSSPTTQQPATTTVRHVPDQRCPPSPKEHPAVLERQQTLSRPTSKFSCIASYSLTHDKNVIKTYRRMAKKIKDATIQLAYAKYLLDIIHLFSPSKDKDPCMTLLLSEARFWIERLAKKKQPEALYIKGQWRLHGTMYGRADSKKALLCFTLSAKAGWAPAHYQLGEFYAQQGQYAQAVSSYRAAADKGHAQALYKLGMLLLSQKLDIPKGLELMKRAAEAQDASCARPAYVLSNLYSGRDIENIPASITDKDEMIAFRLLKKSAQCGYVEAIYHMGQVFTHGLLGQPQDPWQGYQHFVKAAEEKHKGAMLELAQVFERGIPDHLEAQPTQAFRWCKKAADTGYTEAEYVLGTYYEDGVGTCKDYPQALKYFGKAASKGHVLAAGKLNIPISKIHNSNNIPAKPSQSAIATTATDTNPNTCRIM